LCDDYSDVSKTYITDTLLQSVSEYNFVSRYIDTNVITMQYNGYQTASRINNNIILVCQ